MTNLKSAVKGALTGLALLAASCVLPTKEGLVTDTDYQRATVYHSTPYNIKGAELKKVTNKDSIYNLERIVINENDLYVESNKYATNKEKNIIFRKYDESEKIIDDGERKTIVTSDFIYVPTRLGTKETDPILCDCPERKITRLALSDAGKFAVKAQIKKYDVSGVQAGIIGETNKSDSFNIRTMVINGEEFYTPAIEDSALNNKDIPEGLSFYMLPVKGTKKGIDSNGRLTLINEEGEIYKPIKIERADYDSRKPILIHSVQLIFPVQTSTTGQAQGTGSN